jgi:hypothetical protein
LLRVAKKSWFHNTGFIDTKRYRYMRGVQFLQI